MSKRKKKKKPKKKKRKKLLPLPKLLAKTQAAVNKFVRERDKHLSCISCRGKMTQAGHFIAQGSSSFLRFHEDNINGQCGSCNRFKGGNIVEYRIALVNKIGSERVKYLEDNRRVVKRWKRWELEQILEDLK